MLRKKYNSEGRPRKNRSCLLGGIPMVIKSGKITYANKVPPYYASTEDIAIKEVPSESDNFVRRHIYEIRFNIEDESDDERRKREYKEWIEKVI